MADKSPRQEAAEDAQEAVKYFSDEIVESIIDNDGQAGVDITDYSETYHHESHVDRSYSLHAAADILSDLDEFEETDSGLWDGVAPKEAISAMAAYTYGNAVASMFNDTMNEINSEVRDQIDNGDLFLDFESDYIGRTIKKGVKEWRPDAEGLEDMDPDKREALEEAFSKRLREHLKQIVLEKAKS